jgi:hypothetical protein
MSSLYYSKMLARKQYVGSTLYGLQHDVANTWMFICSHLLSLAAGQLTLGAWIWKLQQYDLGPVVWP